MNKKEKYNYFNEFMTLTDYIVKSAITLKDIMENFNIEKLNTDIHEVHHLENEADSIVHKMRKYLIKDFLPPIDREDISLIINKLDNIEDGIDEVLINVKILDIETIKPEVVDLVNILVKCSIAVKEMFEEFNELKNHDKIYEKIIQINNLEELGDRAYENVTAKLYKEEKDPISLIKWTNIYDCLEATIDSCEEISNCVEDAVIKNS